MNIQSEEILGSTQVNKVLDMALALAVKGWHILPVYGLDDDQCGCGNSKCASPGKHPMTCDGVKGATTDFSTIILWFASNPERNVAVRTGLETGIVCIDVDTRHDGFASLADYEEKFGALPETVTAETGGGGRHFIFAHPRVKNVPCRTKLAGMAGIDVKADEGYIVVAPSSHKSGGTYGWMEGLSPWDVELALLPGQLLELIQKDPTKGKSASRKTKPMSALSAFIEEGERNDTLFKSACSLRGKGLDENAIYERVAEQNARLCKPPLDDAQIRAIARSVMRYEPNTLFEWSDLGNAKRLVSRHGEDIRYCHDWDKWLTWSGSHWESNQPARISQLAKETVVAIGDEADQCQDLELAEEMHKWARRSQSRKNITDLMGLAKSEPGIPVAPEDLDQALHLFNVENGTIDLKTGELREHRREDLITRKAPIRFDARAKCPRFLEFLDQIMPPEACIDFLQQALGYSLTGEINEHCLFLLYGAGANGKSTLLSAIQDVCGPYAMQTPTETLLSKTYGGGIPNDIARLKGARFVTATEVDEGRRMAESLVKQLTGGDMITARFMRAEFFEFRPQFKIFLATNKRPILDGGDPAIWRRIHQVPFSVTIPEPDRDKDLNAKLATEREGILAWLVRGAMDWFAYGLQVPAAVRVATEDYRREMDLIGAFIDEACEVGNGFEVNATTLFQHYTYWCRSSGLEPGNQQRFGRELTSRGYPSFKRGTTWRRGLRLSDQCAA